MKHINEIIEDMKAENSYMVHIESNGLATKVKVSGSTAGVIDGLSNALGRAIGLGLAGGSLDRCLEDVFDRIRKNAEKEMAKR